MKERRTGDRGLSVAALVAAFTLFLPAVSLAADHTDLADHDIEMALERQYSLSDALVADRIDAEVTDGIATLEGKVENLRARWRADTIAKATKGVRAVINRLEVQPHLRTDAEIERDIERALAEDPTTDSFEIQVRSHGGDVTLAGDVDSYQEKRLAGYVAGSVRGVASVENALSVEPPEKRPDYEIAKDVEGRLAFDALVQAGLIDVTVEDGEVTLSGAVGSAAEKDRARSLAWVIGTRAVHDDDLRVTWWAHDDAHRAERPSPTDAEVQAAVLQAMQIDPRVMSMQPRIDVDHGVATLSGKVTDLTAKRAAEQIAENTIGVYRVENYLRVQPLVDFADREVGENVRAAFGRDPVLSRLDLRVSVFGGRAYLRGRVNSEFDRRLADAVTARVRGVRSINNRIQVDGVEEMPSDWELLADIESELVWSPFVDEDEITVSVNDGIATLYGFVGSWSERRLAEKNAHEAGAARVRNEIELSHWD